MKKVGPQDFTQTQDSSYKEILEPSSLKPEILYQKSFHTRKDIVTPEQMSDSLETNDQNELLP